MTSNPDVQPKKKSVLDSPGGREVVGAIVLAFIGLGLMIILMESVPPALVFVITTIVNLIGFYYCLRGIEIASQKVDPRKVNDDILFDIQFKKRFVHVLMSVMILGHVLMMVFDSYGVIYGMLAGFLTVFAGVFGFSYAVALLMDDYGKIQANP